MTNGNHTGTFQYVRSFYRSDRRREQISDRATVAKRRFNKPTPSLQRIFLHKQIAWFCQTCAEQITRTFQFRRYALNVSCME